nr:MAG TPA: tail protein [Caudoviricetes sp.]
MIKIYDINDKLLMQAEVTSAAKREQEISKSDYISLSFSAAEKVILPIGAYINYTYKIDKVREVTRKFLLLESYEPTQSDECSWKYTPQFQHPKMILSKTPFFIYTRNSQNVEVKQNVWSFVGTTSVLSGKIANFLNKDLMFGECGWKVIFSNVTANTVNVSFSDNDFISALTAITNAIGDNCEWHIDYDDEIIYIGKVLVGAIPVVLEVGKNVGVPNITNSKEGYYNAFSIFGGTRNITQVNSKGENVSSGDIRLQLDEGNGTILIDGKERSYSIDKYSTLDLRADKTKEPLFTKVLDFSQIYPSLNTYVYNVRGRVKYVLDDNNKKIPISYNADGSVKEYKTFTVWYMKLAYPTTGKVEGKTIINTTVDDGVTHYWYDFEVTDNLLIKGKNIGCSFEANFNTGALSTPLAGRGSNGEYVGFELIYHKEASSSHTSDDVSDSNFSVLAGDYEIIYQEDNEVIIPTNEAEMLIPRGESKPSLKCNITVLYNIAMADTIYYEDAQNRLLEKAKEEIVRLLSDLNNYEVKSYSDVFLEDNPQLQIGQSITYKDGHGYELATRVLKLSTNIDYDFIQSITIGNQVIKGTITQLKEDVQTIIASGGSSGNGGGYSVSQLRKLIAKYGSDNFISKQFDDIAKGTITWEKVQRFLKGMKVGANGDWTLDELDNTHLTTDYLQVRMKAIFETLEILHTDTLGGELFITPVGSNRILKVEEVNITYDGVSQKAYRCYFLGEQDGSKVENKWKVGDQARSKSFNLTQGKYHNVGNHYYWRLVIGVSSEAVEIDGKKYHYVDLSDIDKDAASDEPMVDDILNQCGNRTDITRQSCLVFSAVDTYSPCITLYHGVDGYTFNNKEYVNYGVNHSTGKAFFHVYGDMYFGDRPTSANNYEGDSYVKYDSDKKKVTIKGDLDIKSTYDGKTLDKYIADNSLDKNAVETIIKKSETITDLQNQIDGAIETWFYDGVPTLKTEPASGWDTDMMKNHLGDLYYDNKTGKAYRFAKDGSTYKWIIITDTELTKAIEDSSQALKDAKSKRRIFGSQPVPPYDVNDMWVNATYPSDGSTYKNEILKCSTSKAEGEEFDIADWKLASKYTDDTKAEEAKKAAEKAQEEIKTTQSNLNTLGTIVSNNKKAFDVFTSDGYLDSSEIAAIAQDSKRLEDDYNAAVESYNNVVGSKFLLDKDGKDTTYKTDLVSAKAKLDSAKNELITYLSDIVRRYNASDSNEKAAIKAAAAQKYTNFTNAYKAFYDKLGVANNYITSNLFDGLNTKLITNMAGLEYIKAALVDGDTVVKGGLILSTLIALRNDKGNVTAGINGADTKENGIALWLGGKAIDKQASTTTEEEKKIAAKSLLRFDGTGYFANGNLWWDADGILHADPTSFIINKNNVGVQLALFAPVWKSGTTDTTKLANVLSIDPQKPFTHLDVSGNVTTEGSLKIGGIYLSYDSANNALRLSKDAAGKEAANFYATGGITAYGAGASTTGGGGLIASVISYARILEGSYTDADLTSIPNAYAIKALSSRIDNIATELGGLNLSWNNITGKPSTFTPSAHTHKWTEITDRITKVSQLTNDKGYLTAHQSLASYYTKAEIDAKGYTTNKGTVTSVALTLPTGLTCATKTITTSGTFAISLASGYSIPTTAKQTAWDGAVSAKHTHSNKSVLDGITSTKVTCWDSAYDWYALITTDEETADGVINKWNEVVSFLANIAQTDTLSGIVDGINKSISDEVTRAKKAEGVNASGISTNKTSITTLQGYFTSGSAKKALQLTNTHKLWGNSFNGTADINGSIIVPDGKYISIGNIKMEYDATNKALKITNTTTNEVANLYTSGGVSAYGVGTSSSSGGGLNGSVKSYSNALKLTSESLSEIASAYSIKALDSRISSLEGGSAMNVSVSGSGNAVTAISKSGTTIIVTKGTTFLTSHQSLASYLTRTDAASLYQPKGNYLTSHQSLANYYTKGQVDSIASSKLNYRLFHERVNVDLNNITEAWKTYEVNDGLGTANTPTDAKWHQAVQWGTGDSNYTVQLCTAYTSNYSLYLRHKIASKWFPWIQLATINDIPSSIKSPYSLSWSGYNSGSYDGSDAKSFTIPDKVSQLTNDSGYQTENDRFTRAITDANDIHRGFRTYETEGGSNMPNNSSWHQIFAWGTGDPYYCFQLANDYVSNNHLYFRYKCAGTWYDWKTVIDSSNIGDQSVNYASSAGNADTVDGYHILPDSKQIYNHDYDVTSPDGAWILIKFPAWNYNNEIVAIDGWGDNRQAHCVVHCGSRYQGIWGYQSEYNGVVVNKIGWRETSDVGKFAIVVLIDGGIKSLRVRATNALEISKTTEDTTAFAINSNFFSSGGVFHGNVYSASKLTTSRKIWGQSFDGTGDIPISVAAKMPFVFFKRFDNDENAGYVGCGSSSNNNIYISSYINANIILDGNNIGIGAYNPAYKLHVAGDIYSSDRVIANNSVLSNKLYSSTTPNINTPNKCIEIADNTIREYHSEVNSSPYHSSIILGDTSLSLSAYSSIYISTEGGINLISSQEFTIKYRGAKFTVEQNGSGYIWSMDSIKANGNILATGGITAYSSSDIRLKQDLRKLDYLGIIKAMGGTYGFAWKKDNTRSIGWIAQHVLCNPHLKDIVETDEKGYYKINYWSPKLIATAFGAIEQVGDEVSRLKARVVFLESEVQRLSGDKEDCNKKRLDNKNINSLN